MRRSRVTLEDVADLQNLARAFGRAAKGKRGRPEVQRFAGALERELVALRGEILDGSLQLGPLHTFWIADPKRRRIEAPQFRERVVHHALAARIEPVIERVLVDDTFACRTGRGCLAAVRRAQVHTRRHAWAVQVDVQGFFGSVDHGILRAQLARLFRDRALLAFFGRLLEAYSPASGRGIPIGALTSQHLANLYLAPLDRFVLERRGNHGMVRYMDDLAWWCRDRAEARLSLQEAVAFAHERLALILHRTRIQRSTCGLSLVGFRVLPWGLRLTRRRRNRYRAARRRWEAAFALGCISAGALQRGFAAAQAITAHADAASWRREELLARPPVDA